MRENLKRTDEAVPELNPEPDASEGTNLPALPKRPADSAAKGKWVDYCVALGADRAYLEGDTDHGASEDNASSGTHVDDGEGNLVWVTNDREVHPALTKGELIDLADRLGG